MTVDALQLAKLDAEPGDVLFVTSTDRYLSASEFDRLAKELTKATKCGAVVYLAPGVRVEHWRKLREMQPADVAPVEGWSP